MLHYLTFVNCVNSLFFPFQSFCVNHINVAGKQWSFSACLSLKISFLGCKKSNICNAPGRVWGWWFRGFPWLPAAHTVPITILKVWEITAATAISVCSPGFTVDHHWPWARTESSLMVACPQLLSGHLVSVWTQPCGDWPERLAELSKSIREQFVIWSPKKKVIHHRAWTVEGCALTC